MSNPRSKISIAICGGGIAAVCLALGLLRHSHLDVKVYEANEVLRDDGAAVGLGANAQEALELIDPSLRTALKKAGGTPMDPSIRFMMGTGDHAGEHVLDITPDNPQIVVHRGRFLQELRALLPEHVLQLGKRLQKAMPKHPKSGVELRFEDGTEIEVHAVIGCDGINSVVRKAILEPDDTAAAPIFIGGYAFRTIISIAKATEIFGEQYVKQKVQHAWIGQGGFHLTDLLDDGSNMQVIAGWTSEQPWGCDSPFVPWPKERFVREMQGWGTIGEAMIRVFTEQEVLYAAGARVHRSTATCARHDMCIAGDAAHAMSPFLGAGVGQAIEDAVILSTTLGSAKTSLEISTAFQVYDEIRRPRRLRIAHLSMEAAILETGARPEVGMDLQKMRIALEGIGAEAYNHPVRPDMIEAQERMALAF